MSLLPNVVVISNVPNGEFTESMIDSDWGEDEVIWTHCIPICHAETKWHHTFPITSVIPAARYGGVAGGLSGPVSRELLAR